MKLITSIDTGTEIINMLDPVEIQLNGVNKPFVTKITGIFKSVHPPFHVCINLENRAFYDSLDTTRILWMRKVEEI